MSKNNNDMKRWDDIWTTSKIVLYTALGLFTITLFANALCSIFLPKTSLKYLLDYVLPFTMAICPAYFTKSYFEKKDYNNVYSISNDELKQEVKYNDDNNNDDTRTF